MTFIVQYHQYIDGVKKYFDCIVPFKWYEYISVRRILDRCYKIESKHKDVSDVFYHDIDSIHVML